MRNSWIKPRIGRKNITQMNFARDGQITEEMSYVAKKENLTVVCTKKDYIKVPEEFKNKIKPVNLNLKIEKKNKFKKRVLECLYAN